MTPPYLHHTRGHAHTQVPELQPTVGLATLKYRKLYRTSVPPTRTLDRPATRHPPADVQVDRTSLLRACRAVQSPHRAPLHTLIPLVRSLHAAAARPAHAAAGSERSTRDHNNPAPTRLIPFWCTQPACKPACHPGRVLAPTDVAVSPDHPPCRIGGPKWCSGARCSHARATPLQHAGRRTSRCTRRSSNCRQGLLGRRTSAAQVPLVDAHKPSDSRLADNRACAIHLKGVLVLRQHPIARTRWLVDGKLKAALPLPVGILL